MFYPSILSQLVGVTYKEPLIASSYSNDWGFDTFRYLESASPTTYCYIYRQASQTIISVRGPNPLSLNDEDYVLSPTLSSTCCKVGRIYKAAVSCLYSQVTEVLTKYRPYEIAVIGHSVGGSLALLLGSLLLQEGHPVTTIRTYGQLRTGNADFCAEVSRLTADTCIYTRVIAPKDIWVGYPAYPYSDTGIIELTTTSEAYEPIDNYKVIKSILDGIKASSVSFYVDQTPSSSDLRESIRL